MKSAFSITQEQLAQYPYSETPISISEIAKKVNALVDTEHMKQLSYKQLTCWLLSINALNEQTSVNGKSQKRPTENGYTVKLESLPDGELTFNLSTSENPIDYTGWITGALGAVVVVGGVVAFVIIRKRRINKNV